MTDTITKIQNEKIIAIIRNVSKDKLINLCNALYDGGIRIAECTYDASQNVSDEEISENIKMLTETFEQKMIFGAGTVLTEKQVVLTKNAGGKFIISPDTNPDVIRKTKELELVSIPGALTPSEITLANRNGADFIKIFPVNAVGGIKYLKDISAPLSHIKFLAVGGVNEANISEFLKSGFCGVGIGSGIVNSEMLKNNDYAGITALATKFTNQK